MPEGDVVHHTARLLDERLSGRRLLRAELRVPRHATAQLAGREVLATVARGKHLLTRLDGGLTLHTHLGMDGGWRFTAPAAGVPGRDVVRVLLETAERRALGVRLAAVDLLRTADERRVVGHLGPDLLASDADLPAALARLRARPGRAVGEALLDQRLLAGIGNLYKCEALFLRGVSPWQPVGEIGELAELIELAQRLMRANLDRFEQVSTGDRRRGARTWVFERTGDPCRRCAGPVQAAMQGEPARITYWCPACQPGPAPQRTLPVRALPHRGGAAPRRRAGRS